MNKTQEIALAMFTNPEGAERREAEKMMGTKFEDMKPEQRLLAAIMLAAFEGEWREQE